MANTKVLCVKRFGWKRIAKNTMRFGWIMSGAEEETTITETTTYEGKVVDDTIYINPRTNTSSKVRVWLTFYRNISVPIPVRILELIYNIIFFARRIIAFFLPLFSAGMLIFAMTGAMGQSMIEEFGVPYLAVFLSWVGCIILEGIIARIAKSILK